VKDAAGKLTHVTTVAGQYANTSVPRPPPSSWAARADSDVAIWTIKLEPGARFTLPATRAGANRSLYYFTGGGLSIGGRAVSLQHRVDLRSDVDAVLANGDKESELLLLQGRPIAENVARHGPFVMNTPEEIQRAYADYRQTRFGGWPWPSDEPVHPRDESRFARYADGKIDRPA
jgi:redox-sensitive bicupin YhaK (pirin superfamily)